MRCQTKTLATLVAIVTLSLSPRAFCADESTAQPSATPNIVFIFADDWGWGDLGCHGHPWLKTPNIDRLALEGTEFYQFTVASGVCSPTQMTESASCWPHWIGLS